MQFTATVGIVEKLKEPHIRFANTVENLSPSLAIRISLLPDYSVFTTNIKAIHHWQIQTTILRTKSKVGVEGNSER